MKKMKTLTINGTSYAVEDAEAVHFAEPAQVGQILRVKAVDGAGIPTAWEPVDRLVTVTTDGKTASHTGLQIEALAKSGCQVALVDENGNYYSLFSCLYGWALFVGADDNGFGQRYIVTDEGAVGCVELYLPSRDDFDEYIYRPDTAQAGQVLVVTHVDNEGKPYGWDVADRLVTVTTDGETASHTGPEITELVKSGCQVVLKDEHDNYYTLLYMDGFWAYFMSADDTGAAQHYMIGNEGQALMTHFWLPYSAEDVVNYLPYTPESWTFELEDGSTVTKQVVLQNG